MHVSCRVAINAEPALHMQDESAIRSSIRVVHTVSDEGEHSNSFSHRRSCHCGAASVMAC